MPRQVLPSKLVNERFTITFDFLNQLAWGDLVDAASTEIVPEVGEDAFPEEMLYKLPVITEGRYVSQQVWNGIPGVIYQVRCEVTTVSGLTLQDYARLAILPDDSAIPLFNATFLTSLPYPVESWEGIQAFFGVDSARLINQRVDEVPEAISAQFFPQSGTLVGGREFYNSPAEGVETIFLPITGDLFGAVVTYHSPGGEGFTTTFLPSFGTMIGGRVAYNNDVDGMTTAFTPLGGTLI